MHFLSVSHLCYLFMLSFIVSSKGLRSAQPSMRKMLSSQRAASASSLKMSVENRRKDVLVAVSDGTEEIEAVTIVDTLVRSGANVVLASVSDSLQVTCSRGVKLIADRLIGDCVNVEWDLM